MVQTKTSIKELGKVMDQMIRTAERESMSTLYQDALNQGVMGPPIQVDPRVRARESIRARQFLWTLSKEMQELKSLPAPQLLNGKLAKATKTTNEECKLQSAMWLKMGDYSLRQATTNWQHRYVAK